MLILRNSSTFAQFKVLAKEGMYLLANLTSKKEIRLQDISLASLKQKMASQIGQDKQKCVMKLSNKIQLFEENSVQAYQGQSITLQAEGNFFQCAISDMSDTHVADQEIPLRGYQLPHIYRKSIQQYIAVLRIKEWPNKPSKAQVQKRLALSLVIQGTQYEQFDKSLLISQLADQKFTKQTQNRGVLWWFLLGNTALIGFIAHGTFVSYSWDVMQPVAYFICSALAIAGASRFSMMRKDFSMMNWVMWRQQPIQVSQEQMGKRMAARLIDRLAKKQNMSLL